MKTEYLIANPLKNQTIAELLQNNRAWVDETTDIDPDYFKNLAEGQHPLYLYIGCSDSRLALSKYTKTEPGEIFVHRNIANQVSLTDINFLAILEYSILHLRVKHIIVCGHYGCGGIKAALEGTATGLVDNWVNPIRELYLERKAEIDSLPTSEEKCDRLAEINVIAQVKNIYQTSKMRKALREHRAPEVHGWVLDIRTGLIKDLNVSTATWEI